MPDNIIEHYGPRKKAVDGYVYMEIRKEMHSLPQADILATTSSNSVRHATDTSNNPTCLASGNTLHNPSGSTCAWMTLASNI
jgi:hypothetical protein